MGSEISPANDLTLSLFHCVKLTKRRCLILLLGVSNQTLLMPKSKDSRYLLRVWKHAHNMYQIRAKTVVFVPGTMITCIFVNYTLNLLMPVLSH